MHTRAQDTNILNQEVPWNEKLLLCINSLECQTLCCIRSLEQIEKIVHPLFYDLVNEKVQEQPLLCQGAAGSQ